jgi:hypothetical protein
MAGILSLLAGLVGIRFKLPTIDASDIAASGTSSASIQVNSNGAYLSAGATSGTAEAGNWVTPTAAAPGSYTIRCHVNSGATPTGSAVDTDLACSSNRAWTNARATAGTTTSNVTLTLKDGAGNTVKTATLNITAQTLT